MYARNFGKEEQKAFLSGDRGDFLIPQNYSGEMIRTCPQTEEIEAESAAADPDQDPEKPSVPQETSDAHTDCSGSASDASGRMLIGCLLLLLLTEGKDRGRGADPAVFMLLYLLLA